MDQTTISPFLSECSFLIPEDAVVSAWTEHAPFAFWLTEQLAPRTFVELGTHLGYSYFAVCQLVKKLGLATACYAVDTWKGDEHAGFYDDSVHAGVAALNHKYSAFSTLVRSSFDEAVTAFADKSIDLLHIDGRHFYDDVKADFGLWLPKVADGGIVLFHDTNVRERGFGVWRLFEELKATWPTFEFLHGHGLGVLAVGQMPAPLRALFSGDDATIRFMRATYSSLGAQLQFRHAAEENARRMAEDQAATMRRHADAVARTASEAADRVACAQRNHDAVLDRTIEEAARRLSSAKRDREKALARSAAETKRAASLVDRLRSDIGMRFRESLESATSQREALIRFLSQQKRTTPVSQLPQALRRQNPLANRGATHARLVKDYQTLAWSPLFDAAWYVEKYPDVAEKGEDPVHHYLKFGGTYPMSPGPYFDVHWYLQQNPDVKRDHENPLLHFIRRGAIEGRSLGLAAIHEQISGLPTDDMHGQQIYDRWVRECDTLSEDDRRAIRAHIETFARQPLISVVMPAYNTPEAFLREAIDSVLAQLYPHWELCIADDASPDPAVVAVLRDHAFETRIKWVRRETNGHISAATNSALALAIGEFVALMDHDDILPEHALYEVAHEINRHPDADIIYSDEDHIDGFGHRNSPYFKTDWNRELMLGHNMISHLGVYRRTLIESVGGLREGFEGSQDYDLALRAVDASARSRIRHIPAILYHWRQNAGGQSFSEAQLERCVTAARQAVADSLVRNGEIATVEPHPDLGYWQRVRRALPKEPPLVSIVIPTRDATKLVRGIDGILKRTDYANVEIIVVDQRSQGDDLGTLFAPATTEARVRVLAAAGAVDSAAVNAAAEICNGSYVCLLADDIEVIEQDWLTEMVSLAVLPDVGAVGARLLTTDGHIQHAGIVLGVGCVAAHFGQGNEGSDPGYFCRAIMMSEASAVTGACLLVEKLAFGDLGGFDADHVPSAFADVDFCLRLGEKGYRNIYTPYAELRRLAPDAGVSDSTHTEAAVRYMSDRWGHVLARDPYVSPNLALSVTHAQPAFPPRRPKPWASMNSPRRG